VSCFISIWSVRSEQNTNFTVGLVIDAKCISNGMMHHILEFRVSLNFVL
jgi:hypothetical protein